MATLRREDRRCDRSNLPLTSEKKLQSARLQAEGGTRAQASSEGLGELEERPGAVGCWRVVAVPAVGDDCLDLVAHCSELAILELVAHVAGAVGVALVQGFASAAAEPSLASLEGGKVSALATAPVETPQSVPETDCGSQGEAGGGFHSGGSASQYCTS